MWISLLAALWILVLDPIRVGFREAKSLNSAFLTSLRARWGALILRRRRVTGERNDASCSSTSSSPLLPCRAVVSPPSLPPLPCAQAIAVLASRLNLRAVATAKAPRKDQDLLCRHEGRGGTGGGMEWWRRRRRRQQQLLLRGRGCLLEVPGDLRPPQPCSRQGLAAQALPRPGSRRPVLSLSIV